MSEYIDLLNENNKTAFLKKLYLEKDLNNIPIIQNDSLWIVLAILKIKKAKRILEIGAAIGYSSLCFVTDDNERMVDTIERDENMYVQAISNIKNAGYEKNINVIFSDALLLDDNLLKKEYDVIFIDAAKAQYQKFFEKYSPFLKDDGIIISDNILFHGCVEQVALKKEQVSSKNVANMAKKLDNFNHYLQQLDSYKTYYLNVGDGLAITVKKHENNM